MSKMPEKVTRTYELFESQYLVLTLDMEINGWIINSVHFDEESANAEVDRLKGSRWYEMAERPVVKAVSVKELSVHDWEYVKK